MMGREMPLPVRPSLNALLAQRGAPWKVRRPLASAVATAIRLHAPRTWEKYMSYALLRATDPLPHERRRKAPAMADTAGKVISETPDETAAYEQAQARAATTPNGLSAEQRELAERRTVRTRQGEVERRRWLETSGFAAVIAKAEALLEDLPRAHAEHRRAQAVLPDLITLIELAGETPDDRVLQRFARRADDLQKTIAAPPLLFANVDALRGLINRVRTADLEGPNGARNPNVLRRWREEFTALISPVPGSDHAEWCRQQATALLAEARQARLSER